MMKDSVSKGRYYSIAKAIAPFILFILFLITAIQTSHAHTLGQSYIFMRIGDQSIQGRVEIPILDLDRAASLDISSEGVISDAEVTEARVKIEDYLQKNFRISSSGKSWPMHYSDIELLEIEVADYLVAQFTVGMDGVVPDVLDIEYSAIHEVDSDHRGWLIIEENEKTGLRGNHATMSLIFSPQNQRQQLNLLIDPTPVTWRKFIWEGVWHIWIGLDHVLFIIALVITAVVTREQGSFRPVARFSTSFMNVIKIITLFTIAHSITLSLSALGLVTVPSRAVESVIAFSVFAIAVNNIYPVVKKQVWWFVFGFGLFHGLGFASILNELMLGQTSRIKSLIGFNLGVELGQLAIISVLFPLLFLMRNRRLYVPGVVTGGSAIIAVMALWWSVERATGL